MISFSESSSSVYSDSDTSSSSGGASALISTIAAILAPITYSLNSILDKTVVSVRVRHEKSYIGLVGIIDTMIGYFQSSIFIIL